MRIILLALTLSLALTGSSRAADRVAPETFVGTYQLVEDREGMLCDDPMHVFLATSLNSHDTSYVEIDMGPFPFLAVNGGPQNYEDEISRSVTNSYTTADGQLVFESHEYSRQGTGESTGKTVARLNGNKLHLVSHTHYKYPAAPGIDTRFECFYRKVASGN